MHPSFRIAMLSVHSCPVGRLGSLDTGGMSVYIVELARALGEAGYLVDIFTRAHDPAHEPVSWIGPGVRLVHLQAGEDAPIHKLAVYPHLPDFARQLELFRCSEGLRYDIIFSHYWLSGVVGDVVRRWWDVPHLVMFHTLGAVKNALGIGLKEPELRLRMERHLAASSDRVIASTGQEKRDLLRHYGAGAGSISVMPCGVNLDRFRPLNRRESRTKLGLDRGKMVLYVGRVEPLKGLDRLIEAIALIRLYPVRLIIIGGDDGSQAETRRLKQVASRYGVSGQVSFLGLVEQGRLPDYYSAADVCVVPSYYESFGLVSLESLACGTPVVMTRVGGAAQIIRQGANGFVIDDNRPEGLALSIEAVLTWARTEENRASVRQSIMAFTWFRLARLMAGEFDDMVNCQLSPLLVGSE